MNLSNICFVCLVPNQLQNNNILLRDDDGTVLAEKLKVILLELVDFRPDIPKYLCNICTQELNYVYNFRLKGLKSIITLTEYLAKSKAPTYKNMPVSQEIILPIKSENLNNNENCPQTKTIMESMSDKNMNAVEDINQTITSELIIKTEVDENVENENTQSSLDDNVEDHSSEDNVMRNESTLNNSQPTYFPVYIRKDIQITSSLYSTVSTDRNNVDDPEYLRERSKKRHKCTECHKAFMSGRDLRRHIRTHTGERPYVCDICHRAFGEKYTLKNHRRTHKVATPSSETIKTEGAVPSTDPDPTKPKEDENEKRYKCELCEKSFFIPALLKRHMLTHTGERPFKCPDCPLTYKQSYNLTKHIRGTHFGDKPYACDVCSKAFCDNSSLKCHYRTHRQPHKSRVFDRRLTVESKTTQQCHLCAHQATTEAELKIHLTSHLGEKPRNENNK